MRLLECHRVGQPKYIKSALRAVLCKIQMGEKRVHELPLYDLLRSRAVILV